MEENIRMNLRIVHHVSIGWCDAAMYRSSKTSTVILDANRTIGLATQAVHAQIP